jgi:hypothetical protein
MNPTTINSATAGTSVSGSLASITAEDANGNVCGSGPNAFTGLVTFGGTAGATGTSAAFTAGVLSTFPTLTPTTAGNGKAQPANTTAGQILASVVVQIEDPYGNYVSQSGTAITLSGVTLYSGTNPQNTDSSGKATFNDLVIRQAGNTLAFTASGGSLTPATSANFNITAAAANKLAFTTDPSGGTGGIAWTTQPAVALQDQFGNTVTGTAQDVTLAIQNNAGPGGTMSGTTTVAVDTGTGVANFTGLSVDKAGTGYTLTATGSTVSTTPGVVVSGPFDVNPAELNHFAISTISSPQAVGTAITVITLTAQDVYNNTLNTGPNEFTGTVTYGGTAGITGTSGGFTAGQLTGVSVTPTVAGSGETFTVTASDKSGTSTFDVNRGNPSVTTWPAASAITYGQTLAASTLTGGAATPAGSFVFTTPSTAPNAGTASQSVTYTPTDAANYNTASGTVSVTVNALAVSLTGSRSYDGTAAAAAGILSVANKVGSDDVTVASGSGTLASADPGPQAITAFGTLTLGGAAAGNYTLSGASGLVTIANASSGLEVSSSANPSLPGSDVTFTATLSAVLPGAGTPTGTVQFLTNGLAAGEPVALDSNGQASFTTALLPHGSTTVVAEYAGGGNFFGQTNSLSPDQVVNTPPVKGTFTLGTIRNQSVDFSATKLARTATDADHDPLSITAVIGTSAQGGTVALNGSTIRYTPPTDLVGVDADTLYYTVSDSFGGADTTGTIVVTIRYADASSEISDIVSLPDGNKQVSASGIPGYDYLIQATTTPADPASWTTIGTQAADSAGVIVFDDLDATNYNSRFYRLAAPLP